jgi:hypothetical protein
VIVKPLLNNLKRNKMNYIARGCMYCEGICNKECLPKKETLEEAAEKIYPHHKGLTTTASNRIMFRRCAWIKGVKWMQERMYSEEDLISFAHFYFREEFNSTMQNSNKSTDEILQEWFNQFKKTKQDETT